MFKKIYLFIATACLSIVLVSAAYAHKVQMFTYAEGDEVFVEGYFADGKKAMNSKVVVYDSSGSELLHGLTNDSGQFNFTAPKKSDLRIVLDAGMGHKTEYTLPAGELHLDDGSKTSKAVTPPASKDIKSKTVKADKIKEENVDVSQASRLDDAQLQAIVEKAVERSVGEAIKPLVRSFTEMQQKNSLTTIIGGVGYILGLMGIILYFKSRRSS
ncbi:MAG: hypothetical protein IT392_08875 [Nitrospirae bacterium]|nr:hypothetical protein [Nitrospirota bacterium]